LREGVEFPLFGGGQRLEELPGSPGNAALGIAVILVMLVLLLDAARVWQGGD